MATKKNLRPITFENARIAFRNFSGKEGRYNKEGERNFCLFLDPEDAEPMAEDGWNIKYLKPREEEDAPQAYVQVAVSYKHRPPRLNLISSKGRTPLGEDEAPILDYVDVKQADLIINPSFWDVNGNTGIKAYLKSIFIIMEEDELDLKYTDVPDSAQNAIGGFVDMGEIESMDMKELEA